MRKTIFNLIAVFLIFIGFFLFFQIAGRILPKGKGALQVTSSVSAKILLNGKIIGTTPLCKCEEGETIEAGIYSLQLIPNDTNQTFTTKVKISKNVLTAVDRTFLPGAYASSYTLLLEKISGKNPQLFISSLPDGALVSVDGNDSGVTPLFIPTVSASEHEIELQKGGFGKKTIRIRAVPGYKLIVQAILGTAPDSTETLPGNIPNVTPTPTATAGASVVILDTPTGFLRVREASNIGSLEVAQVNPGETFPLIDEVTGWYKITLTDGKTGWVSSSFAKKNDPATP